MSPIEWRQRTRRSGHRASCECSGGTFRPDFWIGFALAFGKSNAKPPRLLLRSRWLRPAVRPSGPLREIRLLAERRDEGGIDHWIRLFGWAAKFPLSSAIT